MVQWIKIFSNLPEALDRIGDGSTQLLVVHNERICLARVGEEFYAVADKCTHNGESLSKGKINYLGEVVCPWHGYRFQLKTGRECEERSQDLNTYPIDVRDDGFFIGL